MILADGVCGQRLLRLRLDATREICATADDALAHAPGPHDRLREMRAVLGHFEATLVALLDDPAAPVAAARREPSRRRRP